MKFLLVDDHALFRQGLALLLARLPGQHVFLEADRCEAAFARVADHGDIGLILLDLSLPGMSGLEGLARFRTQCPTTPIVLLSANENGRLILDGMRRGAQGFIPKSASPEVMLAAIQVVLAGGTYLPAFNALTQGTEPRGEPVNLTARQREVLALLARGHSNREIAESLAMRVNTVRVHVGAIFKALGVDNRDDAARTALHLGWLPRGE